MKRPNEHVPFGLVLGGGGARGLAHVGVLRALNHLGYYPDAIVGVSMGAVVGATYALNEDWYSALVDMDVSGFPQLPKFGTRGIGSVLKNLLLVQRAAQDIYFGLGAGEDSVGWGRGILQSLTDGKNLEDGRIPICTSATDMLTGKRVVIREGNAVDAIYASSALAGLLPPQKQGEHLLIDGGYSDVAPIDIMREFGLDCVIAVNPSQRRVGHLPRNGLQVLLRSIEITQNSYAETQFDQADLTLHPTFTQTIGVMDFEYKRACIAAGTQAVRQAVPELQSILALPSDGGWQHARSFLRRAFAKRGF